MVAEFLVDEGLYFDVGLGVDAVDDSGQLCIQRGRKYTRKERVFTCS